MALKVLLINPPISEREKKPPLGLLYIGGVLKDAGLDTKIVDANGKSMSIQEVARKMGRYDPQVIGLTAMTATLAVSDEICRIAKGMGIATVVGGSGITADPIESLSRYRHIDYGVVGEGEKSFPELLRLIEGGGNPFAIKGIVAREKGTGRPMMASPSPLIQNLDELPFPAYDLIESFDVNDYYKPSGGSYRYMGVITTRGCRNRCIFCDVPRINRCEVRFRSPANVLDEVELLIHRYGVNRLRLWDDTFAQSRERVLAICAGLKKLKIGWVCSTHLNEVDQTLLRVFRESGCYRVEYGVESGHPETLKFIKKGITISRVKEVIEESGKAGLQVGAFFIVGFPNEDREKMEHTFNLIEELVVKYDTDCTLALATSYPGTELRDIAEKEGLLLADDWSKYMVYNFPVLRTRFMTPDETWNAFLSFQSRLSSLKRTRTGMVHRVALKLRSTIRQVVAK